MHSHFGKCGSHFGKWVHTLEVGSHYGGRFICILESVEHILWFAGTNFAVAFFFLQP